MSRSKSQPLCGLAARAGVASLESPDVYVNYLLLTARGWVSFACDAYENEMPLIDAWYAPREVLTHLLRALTGLPADKAY